MLIFAASRLLYLVYLLAPPVALLRSRLANSAIARRRRLLRTLATGLVAVVLTAITTGVYAWHVRSGLATWQLLKATYWLWGMLLILRLIAWGIERATLRLKSRMAVAGLLVRLSLTAVIVIPWALSAMMAYRVRMTPTFREQGILAQADRQLVRFTATDGGDVAAWWIPPLNAEDSGRTVLLVHGLGSNRANHLPMVRQLYAEGYAVLSIDLRAHGDSGGQVCTFGLREAADVQGALRWLAEAHPQESRRIFVVGHSMGAVSVVEGLANQPDDRVQGVALVSPFSTFESEVVDFAASQLPSVPKWMVRWLGLPMLSLHTGCDLSRLRPIDDVSRLWPVPVLLIHGSKDTLIPQTQGRQMFEAATQPKFFVPVELDHIGVINDDAVRQALGDFFRVCRRLPVL